MRPGGCGMRPMMDSAVTLLPQPDSPTMPSVRPFSSLRSTPSTARTSPRSEAKCVRRPFTSRRLLVPCNLLLDDGAVEHAPRPRLARAALEVGDEALVCLVVEAVELRERVGVVVHAEVQLRVLLGGAYEQGCRLLPTLVAADGFSRPERGDQALGEWLLRFMEGAGRLLDHLLV